MGPSASLLEHPKSFETGSSWGWVAGLETNGEVLLGGKIFLTVFFRTSSLIELDRVGKGISAGSDVEGNDSSGGAGLWPIIFYAVGERLNWILWTGERSDGFIHEASFFLLIARNCARSVFLSSSL